MTNICVLMAIRKLGLLVRLRLPRFGYLDMRAASQNVQNLIYHCTAIGRLHAVSFIGDTVKLRLEASKEASLTNCLVNIIILIVVP